MKKIQLGSGVDDHQAVGFGHLRGNLREMLGAGHTNRDWKTNLDSHTPPYRSCNLGWRAEKMGAACDIGEGFVDGDSFDERREIVKHVDGRIAKPLVVLEMTTNEDQLRTKLARPTPRHATSDSECFSLVRCGQHNSAANSNGFAAQQRIEQLFDRCIEGIEVGVKDSGCCVHAKAVRTSPDSKSENRLAN